jgi:hypothetical protein
MGGNVEWLRTSHLSLSPSRPNSQRTILILNFMVSAHLRWPTRLRRHGKCALCVDYGKEMLGISRGGQRCWDYNAGQALITPHLRWWRNPITYAAERFASRFTPIMYNLSEEKCIHVIHTYLMEYITVTDVQYTRNSEVRVCAF